jgi:predicted nucleic-acid-binding Zn-ribbon protein
METVVLKSFDNYFSASIILTRLQDAGIHCYLKDEYTGTINPILGNAIGGIKLAVDINDESAARVLLQHFHNEYMASAACPKCGRHEIVQAPSSKSASRLTAILTWMFSNYAIASEQVYRCNHCGYETEILPPPAEEIVK